MIRLAALSRLGRGWALALAGALVVGPGAAWACSPAPHGYEEPTLFEGEAGEVTWRYGGYSVAQISAAEDLGSGFTAQYLRDGNGCYGEIYTIVQDCTTGEALAYGGEVAFAGRAVVGDDGVLEVLETLDNLVAERARLGDPLSITEVSAEAQARGVESVVPMRMNSHLRGRGGVRTWRGLPALLSRTRHTDRMIDAAVLAGHRLGRAVQPWRRGPGSRN